MSSHPQPPSRALISEAVATFVGRGTHRMPTADEAGVFALDPQRFDQVIAAVKTAVKASDSIIVDEIDRSAVKAVVVTRHQEKLPHLDDRAIEALVWRWGFINFHG